MEKGSRMTLHYITQNDGAHEIMSYPPALSCLRVLVPIGAHLLSKITAKDAPLSR